MVLQEPLDAERVAVEDFLVGLQRHDDVAVRLVAFVLVADQIGDEGRGHIFVVAGATRVIIAVLLGQLERIDRPVRAQRRHHVEMRHQQYRLARARAVQARDQIALARRGREHLHIGVSEPRNFQPRGHGLGCNLGVAGRGRGVDLDQLFIDVVRALLVRVEAVGAGWKREQA